MAYALSIIANPASPVIDGDLKERLRHLFPHARLEVLSPGVACDLLFEEVDESLLLALQSELHDLAVDVNVVPLAQRLKKLLIADMDSTIIEQECIDELADRLGLRDEISAITERAMHGEIDFETALRERVQMLKGLSVGDLEKTYANHITLTPGAKTLVQTMNKLGAFTALVSGGFTYFTDRISKAAGFQIALANELLIEDGKLTGAVGDPVLGRTAKQNALLRMAGERGLELSETIAVGDGANDLAMLNRAGLGVAFHAKPAVAEAAAARIVHGDLTALLYLQGVKFEEFAS